MQDFRTVSRPVARPGVFDRQLERLTRRRWPLAVSVVYVILGLVYVFRWGSFGQHVPSLWISPQDLWITYFAASQLAHGHVGSVYQANGSFVEFPGILVALAPLGALSSSFHTAVLQVVGGQSVPASGISLRSPNIPFLNAQEIHSAATTYVTHPQWVTLVDPYILILSCIALFACDALAERLGVSPPRRVVLCLVEAVLLWNVTVWWGHPEDAVAVAMAVYALIFVLDRRFVGAGWLFGAAVAFQPLVLLMLPVLVAVVGRNKAVGMIVRSLLPATVLLAGPVIANFRVTVHALLDQPSSPVLNRRTPWTALSPGLGGHGASLTVAAGPIRLVGLALAVGLGVLVARRWRERPELVAWACVLALALRSYTEAVMTDYYAWAALAVGLVVAGRASKFRFPIAVALAIATTIVAQWHLAWLPWWLLQIAGLTGLLVVSSQPKPRVVQRQAGGSNTARPVLPATKGPKKGTGGRGGSGARPPAGAGGGKSRGRTQTAPPTSTRTETAKKGSKPKGGQTPKPKRSSSGRANPPAPSKGGPSGRSKGKPQSG